MGNCMTHSSMKESTDYADDLDSEESHPISTPIELSQSKVSEFGSSVHLSEYDVFRDTSFAFSDLVPIMMDIQRQKDAENLKIKREEDLRERKNIDLFVKFSSKKADLILERIANNIKLKNQKKLSKKKSEEINYIKKNKLEIIHKLKYTNEEHNVLQPKYMKNKYRGNNYKQNDRNKLNQYDELINNKKKYLENFEYSQNQIAMHVYNNIIYEESKKLNNDINDEYSQIRENNENNTTGLNNGKLINDDKQNYDKTELNSQQKLLKYNPNDILDNQHKSPIQIHSNEIQNLMKNDTKKSRLDRDNALATRSPSPDVALPYIHRGLNVNNSDSDVHYLSNDSAGFPEMSLELPESRRDGKHPMTITDSIVRATTPASHRPRPPPKDTPTAWSERSLYKSSTDMTINFNSKANSVNLLYGNTFSSDLVSHRNKKDSQNQFMQSKPTISSTSVDNKDSQNQFMQSKSTISSTSVDKKDSQKQSILAKSTVSLSSVNKKDSQNQFMQSKATISSTSVDKKDSQKQSILAKPIISSESVEKDNSS